MLFEKEPEIDETLGGYVANNFNVSIPIDIYIVSSKEEYFEIENGPEITIDTNITLNDTNADYMYELSYDDIGNVVVNATVDGERLTKIRLD